MWNLASIVKPNELSEESEPQPQLATISIDSLNVGSGYPREVEIDAIKYHINRLKRSRYAVRPTHQKNSVSTSTAHQTSTEQIQEQPERKLKTAVDQWVIQNDDILGPTYAPVRRQVDHRESRRYSLKCTRTQYGQRSATIQPQQNKLASTATTGFRQTRPITRQHSPEHSEKEEVKTLPKGEKFQTLHYREASYINPATNLPQYQANLNLLNKLYDAISELTIATKRLEKERHLSALVKSHLQLLFSKGLAFVDSLLEACEPNEKRIIVTAQTMERMAVSYLMLEAIKDGLREHASALVNMLGYCSANLILLARLYILKMKCKCRQQLPPTHFERCIRVYELSTFRGELFQPPKVLRRMQHNNQTLTVLEGKVGVLNHRFSCAAKKLLHQPSEESSVWLVSRHLLEYLAYYLHDVGLNGRVKFLDCAPGPYLRSVNDRRHTVLIEPHGVLFLYEQGQPVIRSFAKQFFDYAARHFELVVWSWLMPQELQPVLDVLAADSQAQFGTLFRYHCQEDKGLYTKNLNRLGRDLSRVLLIDYDERIYPYTPYNGIEAAWDGCTKEAKLLDLSQVLLEMLTGVHRRQMQNLTVAETLQLYDQQLAKIRARKPS